MFSVKYELNFEMFRWISGCLENSHSWSLYLITWVDFEFLNLGATFSFKLLFTVHCDIRKQSNHILGNEYVLLLVHL
jgi:hypothetical protein